jgi:CheY-like chemotaxis protein
MITTENPLVLVVEDDEEIRELLEQIIEMESYEVKTASNGKEAMELISLLHPRLVLLDLMMPVMNGWEVLSALRKKESGLDSETSVVVLSASGEAAKSAKALADGFLSKPVQMDDLQKVLDHFCPKGEWVHQAA